MSIQSQIDRINNAKSEIASAISAKGVTVPDSAMLDDYAALIGNISGGGTGVSLLGSGSCGENATWSAYSDGRFVVSGSGAIDDCDTTAARNGQLAWSGYRENITEIIIEEGITSIGKYFCYGFANATEVTIGEGVTTIGIRAFAGCVSISVISLPESLTTINNYAFFDNYSLKNITIPTNVTKISVVAFDGSPLEKVFYAGTKAEWDLIGTSVKDMNNATLYCEYEEIIVKEEQEQTISIERNGTTTVLPDEGKTLSKVTVNVDVPTEGGSGNGIIDVTELPTSGIDEGAVYRLTETHKTSDNNIWLCIPNDESGNIETFSFSEYSGLECNIHFVNELPTDMVVVDIETATVLDVYVLETNGIAFINVLQVGATIPFGVLFFEEEGFDRGFTNDPYEEREAGVYVTREDFGQSEKWFVRENGEWKEVTAHINYTNRRGLVVTDVLSGDVTDKMFEVSNILSGEITELKESWFVKKNGETVNSIKSYCFEYSDIETAIIPYFIRSIGTGAFYMCYALRTVTFRGTPKSISPDAFRHCSSEMVINVPWSEDDSINMYAPWGATFAKINYNYTEG